MEIFMTICILVFGGVLLLFVHNWENTPDTRPLVERIQDPFPSYSGSVRGYTTHIGPRGGQYYVNAAGKKIYRKRRY